MTNEQIYLIAGYVLFLLTLILGIIGSQCSGKSHRGATEPSPLPPPPERLFVGPWYLKVQGSIETAPTYINADIIHHIDYDYEGNLWLTLSNGEHKRYASVYEFDMVPIKSVCDYCWQERMTTDNTD